MFLFQKTVPYLLTCLIPVLLYYFSPTTLSSQDSEPDELLASPSHACCYFLFMYYVSVLIMLNVLYSLLFSIIVGYICLWFASVYSLCIVSRKPQIDELGTVPIRELEAEM